MSRLRSFSSVFAAVLSAVFLVSACDSGGANEPTIKNEFSLTVTPNSSSSTSAAVPKISEERKVNGFSFWVNTADLSNEEAPNAFAIYFTGGDSFSEEKVLRGTFGALGRTLAERPETGTYDLIGDGDTANSSGFSGFMYENFSNMQAEPFYLFQSGTVEITTSTENEISGSFSGTASAFTFRSQGEVTQESVQISGSFTATDVEDFIPFDSYSGPPSQ